MVERLGHRAQFAHLRAHGTTYRDGPLRIVVAQPPGGNVPSAGAVAYSIGRRVGPAVRRNRVRRRLRAIMDIAERNGILPAGWYLVSVHSSGSEPGFDELERSVGLILGRLSEQLATTVDAVATPGNQSSGI